jgi:tetratricopeptide (TPR) repeat protein
MSRRWALRLERLGRAAVVVASLSMTAFAAHAALRHQAATHQQTAKRRDEGRAFVARLADTKATTRTQIAETAGEPALVERLVSILQTEGRIFDDITKVDEARVHARDLARRNPTSARAAILLGELELSLHRIPEARAALTAARRLGAGEAKVAHLATELEWLAGDARAAIVAIRGAAEAASAGPAELLRLGTLELELGNYDAASDASRRVDARLEPGDVLQEATLHLYRGLLAEARGRVGEAEEHLVRSLDALPSFVPAADHLAELKAKDDELETARKLYERLVTTSPNPEFVFGLAGVEERLGKTDDARKNRQKARELYEDLLRRFPEAMAWHGAEFFTGIGDARRAASLLRDNLAVRPNGTSRYALARAELEIGELATARELIDAALSDPPRSAPMLWTAARIHAESGDVAGACRHAAASLALRPTIREQEPALGTECP